MTAVDPASAGTRGVPVLARLIARFGRRQAELTALLLATAGLYLWALSRNGWGNAFYAAAEQAGSQSWKAWFFGASDAAGSITVDKPPASLWISGIAVRIFGLNPWSILVPQALMGVATVALLYAIVSRRFGHVAGLVSGATLALTPIAVVMFRFNNPDALLVLLMTASVWALLRGVEDGRIRWMIACGGFVGLAFLTKQLQAFLVVPPLALTYLLFGRRGIGRRIGHLFAALGALIAGAGWWVAVVTLWPADSRPYIGGSQSNSFLELTFGYNGLGRLNGDERGSVGGGALRESVGSGIGDGGEYGLSDLWGVPDTVGVRGGPGGGWGQTGLLRMFDAEQGGQIAWLIPTALILAVAGLVLLGRVSWRDAENRSDPARAQLVVWMLWLVETMAFFSFMKGIFHAYYTVALAPAVAALVGAGSALLWRRRERMWVRWAGSAAVLAAGGMAYVLLARTPDFAPWLRWVIAVAAVVAAVGFVVPKAGRFAAVFAGVAFAVTIAGPAAYAAHTVADSKQGAIISAGPQVRGGGFGGMPMAGRTRDGRGGTGQTMPGRQMPGQAMPGQPGQVTPGLEADATRGGPAGGLLRGSTPSAQVVEVLSANASDYMWVAAAVGSNSAAGYQLATQHSVMPIGGFNGTDPSPTLEQFQRYVAAGAIHYFIASGGGPGGGGGFSDGERGTSQQIREWVTATFPAVTIDGVTLYDLTAPY